MAAKEGLDRRARMGKSETQMVVYFQNFGTMNATGVAEGGRSMHRTVRGARLRSLLTGSVYTKQSLFYFPVTSAIPLQASAAFTGKVMN